MTKMVKKMFLFVLMVAVATSCMMPGVFAANTDKLEQAILTVKSRLDIPEELTEFSSSVYDNEDGISYSLEWSTPDWENNVWVTVNENFDIIFYGYNKNGYDQSVKFASYTNKQLLDIAYDWLGRVNPGWIAELPYENAEYSKQSNIHGGDEYIYFYRVVNGLKFMDDYAGISISNRTGEITNFYSQWHYDQDIPSPSEAMSEAEVAEEFFKLSPIRLQYLLISEDNTAKLVYAPDKSYVRINARKGGEIKDKIYDFERGAMGSVKEMAIAEDSMANGVKLTESEKLNLDEVDKLLSKEELEKKARELKNTGLDTAELESCDYRKGTRYMPIFYNEEEKEPEKIYTANLSFVFNKGTDKERRGNVEFDAESGELLGYNSWGYYENGEQNADKAPTVSSIEAEEKAMEFAMQNAPNEAPKTKTVTEPEEIGGMYYNINLVRHENDIPFMYDNIFVNIDSDTGMVRSFSKYWTENIQFDDPSGIIGEDAAKAEICDKVGFVLSYSEDYSESNEKANAELMYMLNNIFGCEIDAKTGELIEYNEEATAQPADISGHYAETQINALIESGMIELNGEAAFRPNDAITQGELAQMVGRLTGRYFEPMYENISDSVRRCGIITEDEDFEADAAAKRVDGAKYIIRAVGFREIAELPDIFNCRFADADLISDTDKGYVAIANGMGIVRGDENGCFNANDVLTRADAAIMLYNYLAR